MSWNLLCHRHRLFLLSFSFITIHGYLRVWSPRCEAMGFCQWLYGLCLFGNCHWCYFLFFERVFSQKCSYCLSRGYCMLKAALAFMWYWLYLDRLWSHLLSTASPFYFPSLANIAASSYLLTWYSHTSGSLPLYLRLRIGQEVDVNKMALLHQAAHWRRLLLRLTF